MLYPGLYNSSTFETVLPESQTSPSSRSDTAMLNDGLHIELGNQIPLSNTETPSSPAIGSQLDPESPITNSSDNPGTTGDLKAAHCPTTTETPSSLAIGITQSNDSTYTTRLETPNSLTTTVQQETGAKPMDKAVKFSCGLVLGLSVSIIVAVTTNVNKSANNGSERILYKASAGCAIISFFAGIGLLISMLYKVRDDPAENFKIRLQQGLIAVAVISVLASVIVIAMTAVI